MGFARAAQFQASNRGTAAFPLTCFRSQVSNPFSIFYRGNPVKFSFNVILVALILNILISRALHFLLKPLRQCRFVSQLIGGIMIGPSLMARSPIFVSMVFPFTSDFLLKNLGLIGFMLFLFVSGVKMDIGLLKRSGRKQLCIALPSVFVPLVVASIVGFTTRESMDTNLKKFASIEAIALSMSVTTFPIHYTVLEELNLLSSEVGSMVMSTTIISDTIALNFMLAFEAMKQYEVSTYNAILHDRSSHLHRLVLARIGDSGRTAARGNLGGEMRDNYNASYLSKLITTMLASKMVGLSWRDSLAMGLLLSMRGHAELILYIHWIVGVPGFSMLVFGNAILMGIHVPLISILYDPSKPYMVDQRRTIQHTAPNDHLRILLCIKDKEHLPSLVNLLQLSYPTVQNPFSIHAFHLVELIGRANPLFIDHQNQKLEELVTRFPDWDKIHHALNLYQQGKQDCVDLHFFSASTTIVTMYQDVCKLALVSGSVIIVLPLEKKFDGEIATTKQWGGGNRSVIIQVLENAPCSVGLLVDKVDRWYSQSQVSQEIACNIIVLFLGGPDSREALSYSNMIVRNPRVSLTVVRFLSSNGEGDDKMQKKMDDKLVTSFWVQNERNKRVAYREVVVRDGADTIATILGMAKEKYYDMWIVGRQQRINPFLVEGLSTWTDNQEELGIIGDYVSSSDCVNADSVLVIQKQVLRGRVSNANVVVASLDYVATLIRGWILCR
ncbi:hypothetical protein V6N13_070016 [Hibiscus sabdariffa]